jgi:hypothetical protein
VNLYLDLDGVIIRAADTVAGIELAPRALEFLRWATEARNGWQHATRTDSMAACCGRSGWQYAPA